jgi:uncharacterized protein involved in exopolysaccharide biosynthesis
VNDDTIRLSMVGQIIRRRWRLLIVFAVLGAAVGVGCSVLFSPGYEASANVLLQGPREPDEVATQAQVAVSTAVLDKVADGLRWGKSGTELQDSVTAAVGDGNIIQINGFADTPDRAKRLADRVANEFVSFSTQMLTDTTDPTTRVSQEQQQSLRQQVSDTNRRITDLHRSAGKGNTIDSVGVRTELESLRTTLAQALARINDFDAATNQAKMVVMAPAERPTGPAAPTMLHFVAGGAALFGILGVFGYLFVARNDRRLRHEDPIAAAAGAPLIGGIDVPDEPNTAPRSLSRRLRSLVVDDLPWHLPELQGAVDETSLDVRYRRLLSRLPDTGRVLVVVPAGDAAAAQAAARLRNTSRAENGNRLRVVEVSVARPVVPDDPAAAGALLVVTTATRTPWELVGITEACTDAGHEVLGVLVAHRTRPVDPTRGPRPEAPAETVLAGAR